MSVIHFDVTELANLAACCIDLSKDTPDVRRDLMDVACTLSVVSRANAMAYNATYKDEAFKVDAIDIYNTAWRAIRAGSVDHDKAHGTWGLLEYNCIANNGRDFSPQDMLVDLTNAYIAATRAQMESIQLQIDAAQGQAAVRGAAQGMKARGLRHA